MFYRQYANSHPKKKRKSNQGSAYVENENFHFVDGTEIKFMIKVKTVA